jgi:acyl-coenzyme A thioesterase PaaI-like protein
LDDKPDMTTSSKLKQGFLRHMALPAWLTRVLLNLWPPFIGAGIHIEYVDPCYRQARVRMRQHIANTNLFGTHFGGSLFAMTDPFYAILILHNLDKDYVVWDKASSIHFKLPARGTVHASFAIDEALIEHIREMTRDGDKYEPTYSVDIVDKRGEVVATVEKTLYIRRKPQAASVQP